MKIEQIELFHVRMPLIYPWRTAYGSDAAVEAVLAKITSNGVIGWGESSPFAAPCYSPEFAGGLFVVIRDWLAPRIINQDIASGEQLQERLQLFKGNYFAKAALDTAWWDLHSKMLGKPLYQVLGGSRNEIDAGADFGIRDGTEELLDLVGKAISSGVSRVKLKFAPNWDLPIVQKVREKFPQATIHIDCNSNYRLSDSALFQKLDEFKLAMYEQPLAFDDLHEHAQLQKKVKTPICLDESLTSIDRARIAIELGSCQWANIKPGRVGGLTNAVKIHNLFQQHNIPCWVGGMLESAVGGMHCAALATLPNFKYAADVFPSSKFYVEDMSEPALEFSTPWKFRLRDVPGVGAVPNPERLKKCCVQQAILK